MSDQRRPEDDDRPGDRDRERDDYRDRGRDRRDDDYRDRDRDYDAGPRRRDRYDDDRGGRDDYGGPRRRDAYDDGQRYRDGPPAGAYGQPHPQPGPYGAPGYGAPPYPGQHAPRPYYPPRRRKSKAPLIVSLCAGFAYAMFFTLYFTGSLDRMIGRLGSVAAVMQGKWCAAGNTPTDSLVETIGRSEVSFVEMRGGVRKDGRQLVRAFTADTYQIQGVKSGKTQRFSYVLEGPDRFTRTIIERPGDPAAIGHAETMVRCS